MSILKQRIGERLSQLDMIQSDLARKAAVSPSFITDIMTGRKKSIRSEALLRIAAALEVEPSFLTVASRLGRIPRRVPEDEVPDDDADAQWIAPVYDVQVPPPVALLASFITPAQEDSWAAYLKNDAYLPVFAAVDGQDTIIPGPQPQARVGRPPQLAQIRGCYAVRVATDDLAPRYLKGELVYGEPERSLVCARWVIAVRKTLLGARLGVWQVRGFTKIGIYLTPGERRPTVLVRYAELIALHRIVLAGDDVAS